MVNKIITALIFVLTLSACSPKILQSNTHTEVQKDSVRLEIHERIVHDTVYFALAPEKEKIVTLDDSSHLENSVAASDAYVRDGKLHHTLETKKQDIPVPVSIPVADTTKTSTSILQTDNNEVTTTIKYIEKELSWWQRTQIYGFWCMLILSILLFAWKYRNKIIPLVRRFI